MEPHEYQTLFDCETSYWWYKGLRAILLDTLASLGMDTRSVVLDAGCGTGQNLAAVRDDVTPHVFGFDLASEAAVFWPERRLDGVCRASVNEIPFQSNTFDAVICVDVLECDAVREDIAYGELWRATKPGGYVVLVVPAYDWLMSREHHLAVRASRRYTGRRLKALLTSRPVELIRITHLFGALLPAVAFYRLVLCRIRAASGSVPRSELQPIWPVVNQALFNIVNLERLLLKGLDLPFGSSILAVVRKVA